MPVLLSTRRIPRGIGSGRHTRRAWAAVVLVIASSLLATLLPGSPSLGASRRAAPTGGPIATLSQSSVNFGNVRVATVSPLHTITLTNSGDTTLTVTDMLIDDPMEVGVVTTCLTGSGIAGLSVNLAPGEQCLIDVAYIPGHPFPAMASQLRVEDNAPGGSQTISLSGLGTVGYYLAGASGSVSPVGDAVDYGSAQNLPLNAAMVGLATSHYGNGYWLLGKDGGIFSYGEAAFFGSTGGMHLNQPVRAMAATPAGGGYWLVATDGGIFAYGDAGFFGSTGSIRLNQPIVGMAPTPTGQGYWLVAADGGIFAYGDAVAAGSLGGSHLSFPVVGMAPTSVGRGYWLAIANGQVVGFGNASDLGSLVGPGDTIGIAATAPPLPVELLPQNAAARAHSRTRGGSRGPAVLGACSSSRASAQVMGTCAHTP